jgi:hypothetical protein
MTLHTKPAPASAASASPAELEALLAAISEAIEALVAWDNTAFESVVERQRILCEHLATLDASSFSPATAIQVRELNHIYDRLLQHSVQWTHTIQAILEAGGHTLPSRATVHFRG